MLGRPKLPKSAFSGQIVDTTVAEYLTLHGGIEPASVEANSAVREWLQRQLR
jgi:hypothetical protein